MAEYQMIVLTNPHEGQDAAFNDWYDNRHIPDVVAVPGVVSARRFVGTMPGDYKYAALYTLDCDNPQAVMDEILSRWKTDRMPTSPAFDDDGYFMMMVKPIP